MKLHSQDNFQCRHQNLSFRSYKNEHADGLTWLPLFAFISCTLWEERMKRSK